MRIERKNGDRGDSIYIANANIKVFNCTDLVIHVKVFGFSMADSSAFLHYLQTNERIDPKAFTLIHIHNPADVVNYEKYKRRQFVLSKFTDKKGTNYYAPQELNILKA